MAIALYFWYFLETGNSCFTRKNCAKSSDICYLFCPENSRASSGKTSVTR